MAGTVKRIGRDRYRLRLTSDEITLLRSLPEQLRTVLAGAGTGTESPWDLLPEDVGKPSPGEGEPTGLGDRDRGDAGIGEQGSPPGEAAQSGQGARGGDFEAGGEEAGGGAEGGVKGPGDPVLDRLFPQAYLDAEDVERDEEFHRLVRNDLLKEKLANLDVVTDTLQRGTMSLRRWSVDITEDEAGAWLGALNDLRLALGVRLGITEDFDGDIDPSDPRAPAVQILSYLGWLEENLVEALSSGW